jgi:hypothetical protein
LVDVEEEEEKTMKKKKMDQVAQCSMWVGSPQTQSQSLLGQREESGEKKGRWTVC